MRKLLLSACILAFGLTSCVEDKVYQSSPTISEIAYISTSEDFDGDVTVTANVTDMYDINSVTLFHKINEGDFSASSMTPDSTSYKGTIARQTEGTTVTFYIEATNELGLSSKTQEFNYTVGVAMLDYSNVVINEIDGINKSIELYNKGTQNIPLEGFILLKNDSDNPWWTGVLESGTISPGEYIVIIQDNENIYLSGRNGISPKQNVKFELIDPLGNSLDIFLRGNEEALGIAISDVGENSFQRCPDGVGEFKLAPPTQGTKNPDTGEEIPQS